MKALYAGKTHKHTHNWARTVKGVRCSICGAFKKGK